MAEGSFVVTAAITTLVPNVVIHVHERDVAAFQVIDAQEADTVRGEYTGSVGGVVRPMVQWETVRDGQPMRATQPKVPDGSLPMKVSS